MKQFCIVSFCWSLVMLVVIMLVVVMLVVVMLVVVMLSVVAPFHWFFCRSKSWPIVTSNLQILNFQKETSRLVYTSELSPWRRKWEWQWLIRQFCLPWLLGQRNNKPPFEAIMLPKEAMQVWALLTSIVLNGILDKLGKCKCDLNYHNNDNRVSTFPRFKLPRFVVMFLSTMKRWD